MLESPQQNSEQIIRQAFYKCKNRGQRAWLYSGVSNGLFLIFISYFLQVFDRMIGGSDFSTVALITLVEIIILFFYFICLLITQVLLYYDVKRYNKWFDSGNFVTYNKNLPNSLDWDLMRLNSIFSSPSVNIIMDAAWSIFNFIILFLIHPYIGFAAIGGVIFVMGLAYIKIITTNQSIRDITEFSSNDSRWIYIIQQLSEFTIITMIARLPLILMCALNIGYSWLNFYLLNRALRLSNKSYRNCNLSKFYRFLKSWLTINIKIISFNFIAGISAYVVVSTQGADMTAGGMIASSIITARMLILADNIVMIWPNIRNTYTSYLNLSNLARRSMPYDQSIT
ncbi:MAG: hypothetical protein V4485_04955 [Pseudomonadota bacterium]